MTEQLQRADRSPDAMRILGARARLELASQDPGLRTWKAFSEAIGFRQFVAQAGISRKELANIREGFEKWQALPIVPPTGFMRREIATPIAATDRIEIEQEGMKAWEPVPTDLMGRLYDGTRIIVREIGPFFRQRTVVAR